MKTHIMNLAARHFAPRFLRPALTRALLLLSALCATLPAAAQTPTPQSPAVPTPYSWPGFHAGGASPVVLAPGAGYDGTGGTQALSPLTPDALFGMLQGTPTGLVAGPYDAEIPSFLLGNYAPTNPPSQTPPGSPNGTVVPGGMNDVFPNHFADDIFSIPSTVNVFYAPFPSLNQVLTAQTSPTGNTVTVDDQSALGFAFNDGTVTPATGPALTFTWQTGATARADGTATDGTATKTGAKYSRIPVAVDPTDGTPLTLLRKQDGTLRFPGDHFGTATWTLTAATAGTYTVNLNLPNPVDNTTASTNPNKPEYRIPDAHYIIKNGIGTTVSDIRISQQETNSPQFLAGPFPLQAGESLTITLDNSTLTSVTVPPNSGLTVAQAAAASYVLADSLTLTPAGGAGDVQSSPAAINDSEYPEIANALYFGYAPITFAPDNITPYGNTTIGTTPPNASPATPAQRRRIRQLVYFGREENVLSQSLTTGELTSQPVGAVYCVDGNSGGVVWRYQTGGAVTVSSTGFLATGLQGSVKSASLAGPQPFQIGPTAYTTAAHTTIADGNPALNTTPGTFGTYTAFDPTATQFTPADTANLRFALYAGTPTILDATHVLYTGTFRIYPNGSTPDDPDILEKGTFSITATFLDAYNASLSGTLTAAPGVLQPPPWPTPTDLSTSGPINFTGLFQSNSVTGAQQITNAILRAGRTTTKSPPGGFVFSTPTVARIHVLVGGTPAAPLYATKLVVIAADNLGYVYCLDAIGNRDGTSNTTVVDALNQPIYAPQPVFGAPAPVPVTDPTYTRHVGTTNQYWVYRPDPAKPKYVAANLPGGKTVGSLKTYDPDSDLPVPGAFGLASPAVDVQTRLAADATTLPAAAGLTTGVAGAATPTPTDYNYNTANIFIGNSNGTLYKLEALGTPLDNTLGLSVAAPGDPFNASRDIRAIATDPVVPTPRAIWWLPTNLASTNGEEGTDSITSAPALRISQVGATPSIHTPTQVYFTTSNASLNAGRLYRADDLGATGAVNAGNPLTPGSPNYNINAQAKWGFPRAYKTGALAGQQIRPALGSIGGSPVLFTNPNGNVTRAYFAANVRQEVGDAAVLNAGDAGRIWSVNIDGVNANNSNTFNWAYPTANDPNAYTLDKTAQPQPPIGGFQNATPAVGIVQFPAVIKYGPTASVYGHADAVHADVKGQQVPMLYVGSIGTSDTLARLYGIDLDGTTDAERTVFDDFTDAAGAPFSANGNRSTDAFAVAHSGLPTQASFVSSPALVVNSTASTVAAANRGNGGSVFITQTDNTLYQFQAAPVSNDTSAASTATGPDFGYYPVLTTAGPYSSPAVAAFDATDLNGTTPLPGTTISGKTAVDFVYVGDSTTGELLGVTPGVITNFGSDGGFGGIGGGGDDEGNGGGERINLPQFPLHVYVFPTTQSTSTDIAAAYKTDGTTIAPAFEWGENVYIRVANVVPPDATHPIVLDSTGSVSTGAPGAAGSYYIVNGSPVSIQISETNRLGVVDVNRGSDVGQVPATYLGTSLGGPPPANGIVQASGTLEPSGLRDSGSKAYLGAYTYAIGNGSGRKNTPGSRRRIITATQTAQAFRQVGATPNPATDTFVSTVTLTATVRPAGSGRNLKNPTTGVVTRAFSAKVDQPTFAILNPLALAGYGLPIASISTGGTTTPQALGSSLGPFDATQPEKVALALPFPVDLPAYSNGNRVYQNVSDLPKNGVLSGGTAANRPVTQQVLTTTGMINHGLSGANTDATGDTLVNFADRSALGVTGRTLRITMEGKPLQWNDNSLTGTSGEAVNGSASIINPLLWEDTPTAPPAGGNHSLDYPDITSRAVRQTLQTQNYGSPTITNSAGTPDPATGTDPATRKVSQNAAPGSIPDPNLPLPNHLRVQINVPRFQPANTQVYKVAAAAITTGSPVAPRDTINYTPGTGIYFPMGYTTQVKVYVDSDNNKQYTPGEAYRDLTVYTGVPIDMGTQITNNTIDLGVLTQGHGVQMPTMTPYDPYTAAFQTYFKPVTAFNTGNVNLLNVLFDQQLNYNNGAGGNAALPFGAGPLDGNAILPAYDFYDVTGATKSTPPQPYILRTSLDGNLYAVTGKDPRNPALTASGLYAGTTFHKARPGDAGPSALTVPDVPHDNIVGTVAYLSSSTLPNSGTDPTTGSRYTSAPYLSLEVPIGTPVGTYSQNVRLFEGLDPTTYNGFKGPQYGSQYGGKAATAALSNALTFNNGTATQPYSSAVVVKTTVTEVRNTDGASAGSLPHIDAGPAGPTATSRADFGPAAFRNVFWTGGTSNVTPNGGGNINLYWTTARNASATTPAYNVLGKTLPFSVVGPAGGLYFGYFDAGAASWYQSVGATLPFPDSTGLNTNVSVAQEQHVYSGGTADTFSSRGHSYLFVQNTAAVAGATGVPTYQNRIYCLQVNPATGALLASLPDLTAGPAPAFSTNGTIVSSDPAQAKFGVKGLKIANNTSFADPLGGAAITKDLWAFWGSGARGRASIAYTSATTEAGNGTVQTSTYTENGVTKTVYWMPTAALPLPEGLTSASDPSAVLTDAPEQKVGATFGNSVSALDVTYTGIGADGNADVYVSRYRPYKVRDAAGVNTNKVGLALSPFPAITEFLQADSQGLYWRARDTAWVRDITQLDVTVNNTPLGLPTLAATKAPQFDRASGTLIYTGLTGTVKTVYVDLVRGRVRFAPAGAVLPTATVQAKFAPQARRITTDPRADTEPVSFLDEAFKSNEGASTGGANNGVPRVQANRAWYVWRKSGSAGTSTQPTLYFKTQRLTVVLLDSNGKPVSINLNKSAAPVKYTPDVTVTLTSTGDLYDGSAASVVDVDWARGRLYFPLTFGAKALEGQPVSVTYSYKDINGVLHSSTTQPYTIHWLDEARYNDIKNLPVGTEASSTSETAVPLSTAVNEGTVCAFLDPTAYADVQAGAYDPLGSDALTTHADQPHKVWLYWSSTRNGTADIYSQAIEPRFAPLITASTGP